MNDRNSAALSRACDALLSLSESLRAQAIERDNGRDRCRLCRRENYMGEPIPHADGCVVAQARRVLTP